MIRSCGTEGNEAGRSKGILSSWEDEKAAAAYSSKLNSAGSRCHTTS